MISVTVRMKELSAITGQFTGGGVLDVYVVDTSDIRVALISALEIAEKEYPLFKPEGVECGMTMGKVIPARCTGALPKEG